MSSGQLEAEAPTADVAADADARARKRERLDSLLSLVVLGVIVTTITALAAGASTSLKLSAVTMLVNLMFVVSLYVFVGNSGVFSFGHALFMAVGGYTAAIFLLPTIVKTTAYPILASPLQSASLPAIPAIVIAAVAAAVVALLLASTLMRLDGLNAALGTFIVLIIGNIILNNADALTGGTAGLSGIPPTSVWQVLLWALICMALAWAFQQSASCRRLRASREDPFAAQAIGIRIQRERMVAFVVSAFIAGIAGAMFAQAQQAINPGAFYLDITFIAIAMLVVGGMGSLTGAVVGTIVLSVLSELLSRLVNGVDIGGVTIKAPTGTAQVGFALALLVMLLTREEGLTGGRELSVVGLIGRMKRSARVGQAD
jgi:branched-chain amino acid transport system permease protein